MQTLVERGCGLDVHQATVVACLLIVLKNGRVQKQVRTFGTTTRELMGLREWLLSESCTHVAMESTGVYWKPIYAILEGAFEIVVANAQHVKKVPGRKTDVKDAEWIADLLASKAVLCCVSCWWRPHRRPYVVMRSGAVAIGTWPCVGRGTLRK
jgi:transposase